jgi:hypothetical protein
MKSSIAVLVSLLMAFPLVHLSAGELFLKLPVRVLAAAGNISAANYVTNLHKEDVELQVNGKPVPVVDFFPKSRSIAGSSSGRQWVLSFDAVAYGTPLVEVVSHFVHQVLAPSDELLLRSPLHTYPIDTATGKENVLGQIAAHLEEDLRQWGANKKASLDSLLQAMEMLEKKLAAKRAGIRSVLLFINNFTQEWRKYDKEFLLASLEQYPELASLLARGSGEKWMIHFQERNLLPMLPGYRKISAAIKQFAAALPKSYAGNARLIGNSLDNLEKSMLFAEDFPLEELLNAFLGVNINYSVVSFGTMSQETHPSPASPGYEKILQDISRSTGGMFLTTDRTTLVQSLDTLTNHVDHFYELIFTLPGEAEDKNIHVKVLPPHIAVYYKNRFKQDELKWLMDYLAQEISLSAVVLTGRRLAFTLSGFKRNPAEEDTGTTGLVKVEVRLIDDRNTTVYQTENTLKPSDSSIDISLTIPDRYRGYFKLNITAQDLIGRQDSQVNKYVKL